MVRRLSANRVGVVGIAGEHEGLAATATEVTVLLVTGAARLGHPGVAAVAVESERLEPDVLQAVLTHVGELHRQLPGAMTRQRGAVRGDVEKQLAPAAHARLRPLLVIVRGDEDQLAWVLLRRQLGPPLVSDALGALQLPAGRQ
ncbi:hypothetical protein D3C81_1808650 [compost metagenome]